MAQGEQQKPEARAKETKRRRLPIGAEVLTDGEVHFRVWAPRRRRVEVVLEPGGPGAGTVVPLEPEGDGYFSGRLAAAHTGSRYRFRLDGGEAFPDPASRFQPEGPHGPSEVIDPRAFAWGDRGWRGVRLPGQVLYELHLGTFTPEGTWEGAIRRLPDLARVGITVVEVMPVADFPGRFGWGYDGVDLFAPSRLYGRPDDMRRFVDAAHRLGLGVFLDVVYNHLGPDGNYLEQYSDRYFTDRHSTPWGKALNFDGPGSGPVREFYTANAAYWIDEFHVDGLRLDATDSIFDDSAEHVLACVSRAARAAARGRDIVLVAENEWQQVRLVRPAEQGGCGLDGVWNDDFHHSARVALTGHNEAYYHDFQGTPQELVSAVKWGYLFQGQRHAWQKRRRGTPAWGLPPAAFVSYLENHDQVSNDGRGQRPHQLTSPGRHRALTAFLLLAPGTPMLFQGQEFACTSPFLFFADHNPDLAKLVRQGRRQFLAQFPSLAPPAVQETLPDPGDEATFRRCKIDWSERERHAEALALHVDLLRLRREDPVFRSQRPGGVDGAVLGARAFALRFFGEGGEDRLLLVNLGGDLHLAVVPEPLLAPPEGKQWEVQWSTEDPRYGGGATPPVEMEDGWHLPGESAVVLRPAEAASLHQGSRG
jgi:maltooligosyltrehalose trehalohydrolase